MTTKKQITNALKYLLDQNEKVKSELFFQEARYPWRETPDITLKAAIRAIINYLEIDITVLPEERTAPRTIAVKRKKAPK